jgi:hypothetical protein
LPVGYIQLAYISSAYYIYANINGTVTNWKAGVTGDILYADTRFKVGSFTHDVSIEGTQAITGVGFQPKALILFGSVIGDTYASWGFTDGTTQECIYITASPYVMSEAYLCLIAGGNVRAAFTSFDSGGFTVTWSKNGTPTGTGTVYYLALR